jgi:hypothetical protein
MQSLQKVLLRFPPPSLPFAPFVFTLQFLITFWVHVMHILYMLWVSGACNMSLAMLYAPLNNHNMQGYKCKTCSSISQFVLENINRAKGLRKKIHNSTFVLTAFNFFGQFNIFLLQAL